MKQLFPHQFLFRFSFKCRHRAKTKGIAPLTPDFAIPYLGTMDQQPAIGELRIAWNEAGLTIEWQVPGKREPPYGEPDRPNACDGLALWLDMRDTRTIHRASRFCHHFYLLANAGTSDGKPAALHKPINRALENAPAADVSKILLERRQLTDAGDLNIESAKTKTRAYWMQAVLPAEVLAGFDPEVNTRLGFACRLRDREKGDQLWAPGPEFPYWEDPSLWSVMELGR